MVVSNHMEDFFKRHNMHYDSIDFQKEMEKFKEEMTRGLRGEKSTLFMLPTYIRLMDAIPTNKPVIAIDAGGTNLRVAVVTIEESGARIEHFKKYPMPGSQGSVSKNEFYEAMATYIQPVLEYSEIVSFCFSFPSEIQPNQDGKVLYMTKEIYIDGIEGTVLGEEINRILAARGFTTKKFVVLNDTVAAMLSAVSHPLAKNHLGNIGLILGTGLNLCYGELCGNIEKISDENLCLNQKMVINIEAGGYGGFPVGTADKRLDSETKDPGNYLFEKMASGAYLGRLIFTTTKLAVEEDLFSGEFEENLKAFDTFHLWDITEFYEDSKGENPIANLCSEEVDRTRLLEILELIYHRLAKITTISIGAILQKSGIGNDPANPAAITAEGTTFYKSPIFTKYLKEYTQNMLNDQLGLYCSFLQIEDATLLGTAVAGLTPPFSSENKG